MADPTRNEKIQQLLRKALVASYADQLPAAPEPEPAAEPEPQTYGDLGPGEKAAYLGQRFLDTGVNFGQGALMGWGDELAAAGMTAADVLLRGRDPAGAWEERIEQARGVTEGAAERAGTPSHMLATGAGATASALAGGTAAAGSRMLGESALGRVTQSLLAGTAPAGAGRAARIAAPLASGAAWGAAYGAGEGESPRERAVLGATGSAIGAGTAGGMLAGGAALRPVINRFAAPAEQARMRLVQALRRSGRSAPQADRAIAEAVEAGQPYTPADVLGPVGGRELSGVARQPGRGQQIVADFLDTRQADQSRRVAGLMDDALRPSTVTTPRPPAARTIFREVDPADAPRFLDDFHRMKASQGAKGAAVDPPFDRRFFEPVQGQRLFETAGRDAQVVVNPRTGEIGGLIKHADAQLDDVAGSALRTAREHGGRWLSVFDTPVAERYAREGFRPVARIPWDDAYAPAGWDYDAFGRPDVIFMEAVDEPVEYVAGSQVAPVASNYDDVVARMAQREAAEEMAGEAPEEFAGEMAEHAGWHAAESPRAEELERLVAEAIEERAASRAAGRMLTGDAVVSAVPDPVTPGGAARLVAEALEGHRPSGVPASARLRGSRLQRHPPTSASTGPDEFTPRDATRLVAEALEGRQRPAVGRSGTPAGQAPKGVGAVEDAADALGAEVAAGETAWPVEMNRPALSPDDIAEEAEVDRWVQHMLARERGRPPVASKADATAAALARTPRTAPAAPEAPVRPARAPSAAAAVPEEVPAPPTAQGYAEALRTLRGQRADAAYTAAREGAEAVDIAPALRALDDALPPHPRQRARIGGDVTTALERARGLLTTADGQPLSDFAALQQAKIEIDAMIEGASPSVRRVLMPVKQGLVESMEQAAPGFRAANREFRDYSRAIDEVEAGRTARRTGRPEDTVEHIEGLSPADRDAFRMGYLDRSLEQIERSSGGTNVARPYSSDKATAELEALDPTGRLAAALARENQMVQTGHLATGGSRTADNLAAIQDMQNRVGVIASLLSGRPGQAVGQVVRTINPAAPGEATREALARALLSQEPGALQAALQAISSREARQRAIRQLLERSGRSAALTQIDE